MDVTGFDELADLALRKSGQAIHRRQAYLIESRLSDILRRENFSTLTELSDCLKARPNPVFEDEVVTAMAGKETQFFQDRETLSYIVDTLLPDLAAKQETAGEERPIRILCAGGCTGQEPYSLAILLDEAGENKHLGRKIELISVDMCQASTTRAIDGLFNHFEIQMGLSVHRMLKYFTRKDDGWKISDTIRKRVSFEVENLLQPFDGVESFDIILCRNVLPKMAIPIATNLVSRLGALLGPGGILFTGSQEHLGIGTHMYPQADAPSGWVYDPLRGAAEEAAVA